MGDWNLVKASDTLVAAMGYWPTFHDATVLELFRTSSSCIATIHVFQMTDELDATSHFVLRKHHLVQLGFRGVRKDTLPRSYPGDVLFGLDFHKEGSWIRAEFASNTDNGGEVICADVVVENVVPYPVTD